MFLVWFEISDRYRKTGFVTDVYGNYVEVKEKESGEYFIRHVQRIEIIKRF